MMVVSSEEGDDPHTVIPNSLRMSVMAFRGLKPSGVDGRGGSGAGKVATSRGFS